MNKLIYPTILFRYKSIFISLESACPKPLCIYCSDFYHPPVLELNINGIISESFFPSFLFFLNKYICYFIYEIFISPHWYVKTQVNICS